MTCWRPSPFARLKENYKYSRIRAANSFSSFSMFFCHIFNSRTVEQQANLYKKINIVSSYKLDNVYKQLTVKNVNNVGSGIFCAKWYCFINHQVYFSCYGSKLFYHPDINDQTKKLVLKIGEYSWISPSFSWGIFSHMTSLDQLCTSKIFHGL